MSSLTLDLRNGTEGPKHDPYSYSEYIVEKDGVEIVLHLGLTSRLTVQGETLAEHDDELCAEEFETLTGIPMNKFERYYYRVHPYFEDPMGHPSQYI